MTLGASDPARPADGPRAVQSFSLGASVSMTTQSSVPWVEIACDESGFSGTNLLDPTTPVITHASVDLGVGEAGELMAALRSGYRLSPNEFKSGQFFRSSKADEALQWFLAALRGRAHVHLVERDSFLVAGIVALLLPEPSSAPAPRLTEDQRPAARTLYRAGRAAGPAW